MILKLEKQVCSLESAKRLKELGCPQESLFYHALPCQSHGMIPWGEIWPRAKASKWNPEYIYSAYTVAELGKLLPDGIGSVGDEGKFSCSAFISGLGYTQGVPYAGFEEETEANARAAMLVYLKSRNII